MSGIDMLFYSKRCNFCIYLLRLLASENLINHFKLICIDELRNVPDGITHVPTMILANHSKPLVCGETLEWVKKIKFFRGQGSTNQQNGLETDHINARTPIPFDEDIMTGLSDKFALTKRDDALPQSYFGIGDENKNAIFTAPQEKDKITRYDQKRLMDNIELDRKEQDEVHKNIMKENQMKAYIENEQINAYMNHRN